MLAALLRHWVKPAALSRISCSSFTPGDSCWSTSSFANAADTSPLELFDLAEHLQRCRRSRGRLFGALCMSDSVDQFLAQRFMTTVVVSALLLAML